MNPTLHTVVLVQLCGWMIFGLLMLNGAWHPDPAQRAPVWPWGHVVASFFWAPLLVLALLVIPLSWLIEQLDDVARARAGKGGGGTPRPPQSKTRPGGD